ESSGFLIRRKVIDDAKDSVKNAAKKKGSILKSADLPSVTDYKKRTGPGVGLKIGKFSDKNQTGDDRGPERDSHHITQFLLVQYFPNNARGTDYRPFRHVGDPKARARNDPVYPGLNAGTEVKTFRKMNLDGLFQGRGGEMPVILLARPTHRYGKLHI